MGSSSIQIYSGPGASQLCVQAWKRELREAIDSRQYLVEERKRTDTSRNLPFLVFNARNQGSRLR